jgi:hypothetical protein
MIGWSATLRWANRLYRDSSCVVGIWRVIPPYGSLGQEFPAANPSAYFASILFNARMREKPTALGVEPLPKNKVSCVHRMSICCLRTG